MRFRFTLRFCTFALVVPFLCGCQSLNLDGWSKNKTPWGTPDKSTKIDSDEILDPLGRRNANRTRNANRIDIAFGVTI